MAARKTTIIKDKDLIDEVCNIAPEDITSSFVMDLFGEFEDKPRCNPYDFITIPAYTYGIRDSKRGMNSKPFMETIGTLIFNKMYIARWPSIYESIGWVGGEINKKKFNALYKKIGYLFIEDEVTLEDLKGFAMTTQLTMPYLQFLAPSFTDEMLLCGEKIGKEKAKKLKANKAAIDQKDIKVVDEISKELMDYSKELLADDPSMDMYLSGGGGDFGNNFKNMFVMKGVVRDPDPNKGYNIITSNYIDGVSVEEYSALANSLAEGPYSRSKKTETGGYWEKLFVAAHQHLIVLGKDSDCGTKRYITIKVTDKNIDDIMYSFAIIGGKLVEITSKNRDSFIGKTIKMRFSSMCESKEGFCEKCAGTLWRRLGVNKVGVITPQIPSTLKNVMMKAFHDSQVNLVDMDVWEAFCPDSEVVSESYVDLPH